MRARPLKREMYWKQKKKLNDVVVSLSSMIRNTKAIVSNEIRLKATQDTNKNGINSLRKDEEILRELLHKTCYTMLPKQRDYNKMA